MSKKDKVNSRYKIYTLKIVYNVEEDKCESIQESLTDDGSFVTIIPNVNLEDYFDEDTVRMINESFEVGEA